MPNIIDVIAFSAYLKCETYVLIYKLNKTEYKNHTWNKH